MHFICHDLQDGPLAMPRELMFAPSDLLEFNIGPPVLQLDRQKRIIGSLLELGFIATNMEGYMGPRLDDVTLGTLGPGEFFGELVRTFAVGTAFS